MEEERGQHSEENWQVNDLRSGVAKVYADAKSRNQTGKYVAGAWAAFVLVYAALNVTGVVGVAPPAWDFAAGAGVVFLALLGYSSGPLLAASAVILADLAILAFNFPELRARGDSTEYAAAALRVLVGPAALSLTVGGYLGALSIEAFKRGFSPGQDWRTRINPMMLQAGIFGSCAAALILGATMWFGAINAGFAQTDVKWKTRDSLIPDVEVQVARPEAEKAEVDRRGSKHFLNIEMLNGKGGDDLPDATEYPEAARPIPTLAGLDAYAKHQVEDAHWFGEDSDEQGCELEAQGRQDRCRDDRCRHWARIFLRACLTKCRKTEKYCDGVPPPMKLRQGELWSQGRCVGRPLEMCREMLFAVQGHCHPPETDVAAKPRSGAKSSGNGAKPAPAKDGSSVPDESGSPAAPTGPVGSGADKN